MLEICLLRNSWNCIGENLSIILKQVQKNDLKGALTISRNNLRNRHWLCHLQINTMPSCKEAKFERKEKLSKIKLTHSHLIQSMLREKFVWDEQWLGYFLATDRIAEKCGFVLDILQKHSADTIPHSGLSCCLSQYLVPGNDHQRNSSYVSHQISTSEKQWILSTGKQIFVRDQQ